MNSKEPRNLASAVMRSQPLMGLNMAELDSRSPGWSVQMFASFPYNRAAEKRSRLQAPQAQMADIFGAK